MPTFDGLPASDMSDPDSFKADLEALGFRFVQQRMTTGVIQMAMQANRYLSYWVHWDADASEVLFTWEYAIGEFMSDLGLQVGSNEELNSFLYPKHDARGPQEISFVVSEIDRAEQILRSVDFVDGTGG